MNSTTETIRVELSYVASHLRAIQNKRGEDLLEGTRTPVDRIRSVVDSLGGEDTLARRVAEIEASFDRIADEIDVAAYPEINEGITELQSTCRREEYADCLRLARELLRQCEERMDIDPLYEGDDPLHNPS